MLDNREDPEGDCQEIFYGMFENQIIITMYESNKAHRYVKHTCIYTHTRFTSIECDMHHNVHKHRLIHMSKTYEFDILTRDN